MNPLEPTPSSGPPPVISKQALRLGRLALWLSLLGLLAWAALAPMDEGIPAAGMVAVDTKRKAVQHLQGGIVREVHVGEGKMVREGDVLMVLEQGSTRASFETVRQQYLALRSAESRLLSEQLGSTSVAFHPDIASRAADPTVRQHMDTQSQLLRSRQAALQANLNALTENRAGLQEQRKGVVQVIAERQRQISLVEEELEGLRELVRDGYAPRNRQLELERNRSDIRSALAEASASLQRIDRQMDEVGQRMQAVRQEYRKEVDSQLADVRREVQADAEKLKAVTQDLARTELRAPASGQVVGLMVQSVGAVISPGQKLMDIVPIDRISPHQKADIRFSAFSHSPLLVVEGQVESVSNDLVNDAELKQLFYLARISLTSEGMNTLAHRELQAGLPAEVLIKTGSRSLLSYLAYPLVRRLHKTFREE